MSINCLDFGQPAAWLPQWSSVYVSWDLHPLLVGSLLALLWFQNKTLVQLFIWCLSVLLLCYTLSVSLSIRGSVTAMMRVKMKYFFRVVLPSFDSDRQRDRKPTMYVNSFTWVNALSCFPPKSSVACGTGVAKLISVNHRWPSWLQHTAQKIISITYNLSISSHRRTFCLLSEVWKLSVSWTPASEQGWPENNRKVGHWGHAEAAALWDGHKYRWNIHPIPPSPHPHWSHQLLGKTHTEPNRTPAEHNDLKHEPKGKIRHLHA